MPQMSVQDLSVTSHISFEANPFISCLEQVTRPTFSPFRYIS